MLLPETKPNLFDPFHTWLLYRVTSHSHFTLTLANQKLNTYYISSVTHGCWTFVPDFMVGSRVISEGRKATEFQQQFTFSSLNGIGQYSISPVAAFGSKTKYWLCLSKAQQGTIVVPTLAACDSSQDSQVWNLWSSPNSVDFSPYASVCLLITITLI